jgi:hypothetical protein
MRSDGAVAMFLKLGLAGTIACVGCVTNMQQHLAFATASVVTEHAAVRIGDVIRFDVRPPVAAGTRWTLECHGRARFAADPTSSILNWTAQSEPVRMETVQAPWDPPPGRDPASSRGWLWFGLEDHGESSALDRNLPAERLPYRELGPVTFSSVVSTSEHKTPLSARLYEGRVLVTYSTPVGVGVPLAPSVDAKLVESGGKDVLYAEVSTNFGELPKQRLGYEVTLSYAVTAAGPVDVVVVGWIGHGPYYSPFTLDRFLVDPSKLEEQVPEHTPIRSAPPPSNATSAPAR